MMVVRKYLLPLLSVVGVGIAVWLVVQMQRPVQSQPPVVAPPINPYRAAVSGAGVVEAASENIVVAPALGGIVTEVYVTWGQQVKAGERLYQIDDRPMRSQIAVQEAAVAAQRAAVARAEANVARLKASPRPEDVPISKAALQEAQAAADKAADQWQRIQRLADSQAVTQDEYNQRKFTHEQAQAALAEAKANLDKLLAGSWRQDIAVAEAELMSARSELQTAQARLEPLKVDLDRLCVTAPVDGQILRLNVRKGNFVAAAGSASASDGALVIGTVEYFHIRVDIDENDVTRFRQDSPAQAHIRGHEGPLVPLTFVRVEPFVMPKRELTGVSSERVDTRVLQVIYRFERGSLPVYVGQQVDVFVEAK